MRLYNFFTSKYDKMFTLEQIKEHQIFWSDSVRDRFFKKKYNSFKTSWIKKYCEKIDDFLKQFTNAKIVKSLIEIETGYKRWQYISREEWLKGYKYRADRAIWNTYFDTSTGQMIDSYSKVREIEKSGRQYMTMREHEKEMTKINKEQKKKTNQRIHNKIQQSLDELSQGKSFVKELSDKGYGK